MLGSLGLPEILFILVLALLVFGPRRLPEVGRTIGRALGEFRRATGDLKRTFDQETSAFEQDVGLGTTHESPSRSTSGSAGSDATPSASAAKSVSGLEAEAGLETERPSESEDDPKKTEPS